MNINKLIFAGFSIAFLYWVVLTQDAEVLGIVTADAFTASQDAKLSEYATNMGVLTTFAEFFGFLLFYILSFLLEPDILDLAKGRPTHDTLNIIWQVARDIMNIIFAFLLVIGAIITVITAKRDLITTYAVKFCIAVILVNFSWFFPRVVLDTANVLAATIYNLPDFVASKTGYVCQVRKVDDQGVPTGQFTPCYYINNIFFLEDAESPAARACPPLHVCKDHVGGLVRVHYQQLGANTNTAYGMLNGLIINYGRLGQMSRVQSPFQNNAADARVRGLNRVQDYLFYIVYLAAVFLFTIAIFFPLAAMVALFIIRIPIIWLTIAFMPFMFAGVVVGDRMGQFNPSDLIFKKFLAAAFLPAAVAIPFAVGFIMIASMSTQAPPTLLGNLDIAKSPVKIETIGTMWDLIWLLITFFVIWKGFFMATKIDSTFESVAGKFQAVGENIGKFALKAPLAFPVIPTPGGGSVSPLRALQVAQNPNVLIDGAAGKDFSDIANRGRRGGSGGTPAQSLSNVNVVNNVTNNVRQITTMTNPQAIRNQVDQIEGHTGVKFTDASSVQRFVQELNRRGGVAPGQMQSIIDKIKAAKNIT